MGGAEQLEHKVKPTVCARFVYASHTPLLRG